MPNNQLRVNLLCEDRRTERLVRQLCDRYGLNVQSVEVAPKGKGDASEWVKRQYPVSVARRRSKNFQRNLGLIVVIDGDNHGVAARKNELDAQLKAASMPLRIPQEPVALFVPTWSIETWLAHLCGRAGVVESAELKHDSALQDLWRDGPQETSTIKNAVAAWRGNIAPLPSLNDAYGESQRVGLP